jgi:hypothetical protein
MVDQDIFENIAFLPSQRSRMGAATDTLEANLVLNDPI